MHDSYSATIKLNGQYYTDGLQDLYFITILRKYWNQAVHNSMLKAIFLQLPIVIPKLWSI